LWYPPMASLIKKPKPWQSRSRPSLPRSGKSHIWKSVVMSILKWALSLFEPCTSAYGTRLPCPNQPDVQSSPPVGRTMPVSVYFISRLPFMPTPQIHANSVHPANKYPHLQFDWAPKSKGPSIPPLLQHSRLKVVLLPVYLKKLDWTTQCNILFIGQ
jgi:hypothetical protein